jgi:peptidoglycan hydrolase-like protein with peptidoglycan-binding domain
VRRLPAVDRGPTRHQIRPDADTLPVTTTIAPPPSFFRLPAVAAEVRAPVHAPVLIAHHVRGDSTAPDVDPTAADAGATVESHVAGGDVLEAGDTGSAVRNLQRRLDRLGYPVGVDGQLGPATTAAVERFQADHGVATTGRVGPTTLLTLRVAEARRPDIAIAPLFPSVGQGRHLRTGDRGLEVETLQRLLSIVGQDVGVDGVFGAATRGALQDFQRAARVTATGELGPTTLQALDAAVDALGVDVVARLALPSGYGSLEQLAQRLVALDGRFSPTTSSGRSTLAMALAIGGTEVYGQGTSGSDFFTRRGGTGNNMLGFAQFNLDYHAAETSTPTRYAAYLADILNGVERMPNSGPAADHARALSAAVADGRVDSGADLEVFLRGRGFGGSNWQGIDDGWGRNPGLGDALVRFLQRSAPTVTPVFT